MRSTVKKKKRPVTPAGAERVMKAAQAFYDHIGDMQSALSRRLKSYGTRQDPSATEKLAIVIYVTALVDDAPSTFTFRNRTYNVMYQECSDLTVD